MMIGKILGIDITGRNHLIHQIGIVAVVMLVI